ncbi:MAG TPA: hypothetical protein VE777_03985 [Gaiellales bacterium]|nr:hypothetical protein [Gaiellales bacterium]
MKASSIVAALAATLVLSACGGSGGSAGSAKAGASGSGGATVSADSIGSFGNVLVDASGQPLYASDQEAGGKVLCTGKCLSFWRPLTISGRPSAASLPGDLGTVTRPDGGRQVTYNGHLLYSFAEDRPGQVTGNGFADAFGGRHFTWHVVRTSGGLSGGGTTTGSGGYGY